MGAQVANLKDKPLITQRPILFVLIPDYLDRKVEYDRILPQQTMV
jgi:hypothetical protein